MSKLRRKLFWLVGISASIVLFFYLLFYVPMAPLPAKPTVGYIDMHVHAAGLGLGETGAFVGDELAASWKFPIYLRAFDVTEEDLDRHGDAILLKKLSDKIEESQYVDVAVVLAMDGAVDEHGELDRERTQFYVPNEYLIEELKKYPNLLFAASVNPLRHDSLERLDYVAQHGAVLMKWLPNIMHFDPNDTRIEPFYRRLKELCLPLLTHTGAEHSFGEADDTLGDPFRLTLPLSLGVTVIAAHIATTGHADGEEYFDRFVRMFDDYPNLYADISSLTQINKTGYLKRALEVAGLSERLIYGTDWPLHFFPLVSPYYHLDMLSLSQANTVQRLDNAWDRDVVLKRYAGVPEHVFERFPTLMSRKCEKEDVG